MTIIAQANCDVPPLAELLTLSTSKSRLALSKETCPLLWIWKESQILSLAAVL